MRTLTLLVATLALAGCFRIYGRHVVQPYGVKDTGSYRILVPESVIDQQKLGQLVADLAKFSTPVTRRSDAGEWQVQDLTGRASMERFYDRYDCVDAAQWGFVDCHYVFEVKEEVGRMMGWALEWEVEVAPSMRVLNSNHTTSGSIGDRTVLRWSFDGNRLSSARIEFTVRAPKA